MLPGLLAMEPEVNEPENSEPASIDDFEPGDDVDLDEENNEVPLPYIIKKSRENRKHGKTSEN